MELPRSQVKQWTTQSEGRKRQKAWKPSSQALLIKLLSLQVGLDLWDQPTLSCTFFPPRNSTALNIRAGCECQEKSLETASTRISHQLPPARARESKMLSAAALPERTRVHSTHSEAWLPMTDRDSGP